MGPLSQNKNQLPPLCVSSDAIGGIEAENDGQAPGQHDLVQRERCDQADILTAAARLLVEIAGSEQVHIEMSPRGPKKYYDVPRPLHEQDACAHLQGWKTKGAYVRHPGGKTRALCYDADTPDDWQRLKDAGRLLTYGDYCPLLEGSPAGRGGHLWIIYSDLVDARSAHRHLLQFAPMLREIRESWPGPGSNKVRLPGGKYVKPGFHEWCTLSDAHDQLLASNGQEAARILLDSQTPAEIVPEYPPELEPGPATWPNHQERSAAVPAAPLLTNQDEMYHRESLRISGSDSRQQAKYGHVNTFLWFQFTPTQVATWYNERHDTEDFLAFDRHGMANASAIGRPEHTPSVGSTKDRKRFTDFGASARREDGRPEGGDVLELAARIDGDKAEVLSQAAKEMVREARKALESAARSGIQPPAWVRAIMSQAGHEHFNHLAQKHGHQAQTCTIQPPDHDQEHTGG